MLTLSRTAILSSLDIVIVFGWVFVAQAAVDQIVVPPRVITTNGFDGSIQLAQPAQTKRDFTLLFRSPVPDYLPETNVRISDRQTSATFHVKVTNSWRFQKAGIEATDTDGVFLETRIEFPGTGRPGPICSALIGLASVLFIFLIIPKIFAVGALRFLFIGDDGLPSTSKCQPALWTIAAFFAYTSIAFAKWVETGGYTLSIPQGLAIAIGVSLTVAVAAKGITAKQVEDGKIRKANASSDGKFHWSQLQFLFVTDDKRFDLGKVQIMGWTFVGLLLFFLEWYRIITLVDARLMVGLPELDGPLWVLMGLANGAYLGGKLVVSEGFQLLDIIPSTSSATETVSVVGTFALNANQSAKLEVIIDGQAAPTWKASRRNDHAVHLVIPPSGQPTRVVQVGLVINGVSSIKPLPLEIS